MKMNPLMRMVIVTVCSVILFVGCGKKESAGDGGTAAGSARMALVVKNIGNPFFDAVNKGWQEACGELDVEAIYRGPEQPTPDKTGMWFYRRTMIFLANFFGIWINSSPAMKSSCTPINAPTPT